MLSRTTHIFAGAGAVIAAAVVLVVMGTVPEKADAEAVAGGSSASVPELAWRPCPDPDQSGFKCATARVPLDYGDPQGPTIELAVIKHKAPDPANRVGKLFFNPGGPGGVGTEDLPAYFDYFPSRVRERFDIVSWDPRGIGASTAVQCFPNEQAEQGFFASIPFGAFPVGDAERRAWIQRYAQFGQRCARRNGDLLEHVSTYDSARDLNLLRRAVGAEKMNFLGISYGTLLGATYANLFPYKVRAMVLDGNVDPVAWTNGGKKRARLDTALRLESDKATAKTLNDFLALCGRASKDRCAFSAGSAAATRAKWEKLLHRLRQQPATFNGQTITYAQLVTSMWAWLNTTEPVAGQFEGWTYAATVTQKLWQDSGTGGTAAPSDPAPPANPTAAGLEQPEGGASGVAPQRYDGTEQGLAVECGESPNPRDPRAFVALDALARERAGAIGRPWVWNDSPCADWPARAADRYVGPWDRRTAKPILAVNNTSDPQTPYSGGVTMARLLARARLLTVDGYGHTVLLNPSSCAKNYEAKYIIAGKLPPPGTACQPDWRPFAASPGS